MAQAPIHAEQVGHPRCVRYARERFRRYRFRRLDAMEAQRCEYSRRTPLRVVCEFLFQLVAQLHQRMQETSR